MRPSEQIALVTAEVNLDHGTVSVNKARVAGIDRDSTKTDEDRTVVLCPRALTILKCQLELRNSLKRTGCLNHDHVFFQAGSELIRNLQHPHKRWQRTLASMKLRYRKPYSARHTSVSWNLMLGKNPLWVARQHGHSVGTMLRIYTAWTDGALESDIEAIDCAMKRRPAYLECSGSPPHQQDLPLGIEAAARILAANLAAGRYAADQLAETKGK